MSNSVEKFKELEGKICVGRSIDDTNSDNLQYLLDRKATKPRVFNSEKEAKEFLINKGYTEESIERYKYIDAVEVYKKYNWGNPDDIVSVKDLGF